MIHINLQAQMRCEAEGCEAAAPAQLVLMAGGTFAFKPSAPDWQVGVPNGPAPFRTHCPKHASKLLVATPMPKVIANGH